MILVQALEAKRSTQRLERLETLKKKRGADEQQAELVKEAKEKEARQRLMQEERRRKVRTRQFCRVSILASLLAWITRPSYKRKCENA